MARFTIFGKQLTEAEIEALKTLAEEAGGHAEEIEMLTEIGGPEPEAEDSLILMLGTPATCGDVDLEANLAKAANGARRAIWIWPETGDPTRLPPPAAKYCYSVIPWNAEKLRAVAADDDITCFETPTGEPLPKVPTERNLCVEEKATGKRAFFPISSNTI